MKIKTSTYAPLYVFVYVVLMALHSFSILAKLPKAKGLMDAQIYDLSRHANREALFIFFGPNCSACLAQRKSLSCLPKSTAIYFIGMNGTERELRREAHKLSGKNITFLIADDEVKRFFKVKDNITPQIVTLRDGQKKRFVGFQTCLKLLTQEG